VTPFAKYPIVNSAVWRMQYANGSTRIWFHSGNGPLLFLSIYKTRRGITKAAPVVHTDQRSHYKRPVISNDVFMRYRRVSRTERNPLSYCTRPDLQTIPESCDSNFLDTVFFHVPNTLTRLRQVTKLKKVQKFNKWS
jgi:hypothetical protein